MQTVTTIGLDIAKSVFQVHGVGAAGQVVIRRQLKRRTVLAFFQQLPPCLVGIEACASSHYWSRELQGLGHTVRLMPPAYVKPYVKRQKNDMADAEAICEAVTRATMRFVPTKTPEQQSCLVLHRARHLFIRQQTAVINSIRAYLAEFGIVAPVGRRGVEELLHVVADPSDKRVPEIARACLAALGAQLLSLKEQIVKFDRMIMAWHRSNETSKRQRRRHPTRPVVRTWPEERRSYRNCPTIRFGPGRNEWRCSDESESSGRIARGPSPGAEDKEAIKRDAKPDRIIELRGYQNRSEAIRDLARTGIQQSKQALGESRDCVAALVYVY